MVGIILFFLLQISVLKCDVIKGSLTFVIDDTGSMSDDIAQVIDSANKIFDTVMKNEKSPIDNFILVTFNDPDVRPATITRDKDVFKRALNSIVVDGGEDCEEYSMSGIESGLTVSLPRSFIYVFTDASAKDYRKFEQVKSLALKKSSQVVFVLTGRCNHGKTRIEDEQVYYDLAFATSGQVFNIMKNDVKEILDFVVESIKSSRSVLSKTELPPGYGHKINYTSDGHIKDIHISVTGTDPKIDDVTDPEGGKAETEDELDLDNVVIVKVPEAKPGVYTAKVGSREGNSSVLITGRSTIDFQHGFSVFKPTTIKDTSTRPQKDIYSYLSIKLNVIEGGDVKLTHVKIVDVDGKPILEEPLEILNDKERLYITKPVKTPNDMFRIMVIGYTVADNSTITRMSPTLIEPQKPELEAKVPRAPKITIEGAPKVSADYNDALKLSCKVHAYPKPDVIWIEEDSGSLLSSSVSDVEPPYEYISILDIEKVNKNATYACKASNTQGMDTKNIAVEIPVYFIVMASPKDAVVPYNTVAIFLCKIDASPPAKITWYKNGNIVVSDDKRIISHDGSVLNIPKMTPTMQGYYSCEANNGVRKEEFNFKLAISGVEAPKIDKVINKVHAANGSDPELICKVTEGIPEPRFTWYYKHDLKKSYRRMRGLGTNKIEFKNINQRRNGLYKCVASNELGYDDHQIELVVEYPPVMKQTEESVSGKAGEELTLTCDVESVPPPFVTWIKDDVLIRNTPSTPIYRDHSLRLKLSVEDSGTYTCKAANRLGRATKTVNVEVYVPAYIQPPTESPVNLKVGDDIDLICEAYGVPTPELKWIFHGNDGKDAPIILTVRDPTKLLIPRAQLQHQGFYTCLASNNRGNYSITYDVRVNAPPIIENVYKDKTFKPVEGDLVLMIKCNATGSPKPVITWTKDRMSVASGTEWYDIDEFGTLYIKNIDRASTGMYACRADNILGRDVEIFYVVADPYPRDEAPIITLLIEEGLTHRIQCKVPHELVDLLRWYKDSALITTSELTITNAKVSDAGLYACRVSNLAESHTDYTRVVVGFKPKFITKEDENVEVAEGYIGDLVCVNEAMPPATITWWHNGVKLNETSPEYEFIMKSSDNGNYTCEVSNEFGSIQRTFNMRSRDCLLSVKNDFTQYQPLMFSPSGWPTYEVVDGKMIIPRDEYISLTCPNRFSIFPTNYAIAFCEGEDNFKIKGMAYKYSELKCSTQIEPSIFPSGTECLGSGTEMLNVEYEFMDSFLRAYDVCFDRDHKAPIYTKHELNRQLADVEPTDPKWFSTDMLRLDGDELYNCNNQLRKIFIELGTWPSYRDGCCFKKRQLINPRDMMPGLLQSSTYNNLNVVPHWSTCNTDNWDDLEQRVRNLAKSIVYPLTVWTGTYKQLQLRPGSNFEIDDRRGTSQPVPHYLWKVIQDPITHSSLAIVTVNVPNLLSSAVYRHVLCGDICHDIPWLSGGQWHNVSRGYTFCCDLRGFEKAFGYDGIFDRGNDAVLYKVSDLPTHSLA